MFAHIHVYYNSVKSTYFRHTVILFFYGKNTTYFSYMQAKRRENAKLYQEKNEQKSPAAPCREWRGTGRRTESLESGFGWLASERGGAGEPWGWSAAGDAAHAEGGADGGEHGRSEVPEELDEALAVFRGHGGGLLSVGVRHRVPVGSA